jgi:hypothetical protein
MLVHDGELKEDAACFSMPINDLHERQSASSATAHQSNTESAHILCFDR